MIETQTPPPASAPAPDRERSATADSPDVVHRLLSRITRLEWFVGAVVAIVMAGLVVIEPNILEAPFENERTLLFTFGGTALAAAAFVAMLWLRVPSPVRVLVLLVPFVFVNWWLISPYFVDDVVDEGFSTSISEQLVTDDPAPATDPAAQPAGGTAVTDNTTGNSAEAPAPTETAVTDDQTTGAEAPTDQPDTADAADAAPEEAPVPEGPVLVGAGQFVGLAGHEGTGDAGLFRNPDGSFVLRFENFDIENGPDLEVYLVPGADQVDLAEGSIHLGALKGNIGDQNYELPAGTELPPGDYTALVWCEAFSVEFVGATFTI